MFDSWWPTSTGAKTGLVALLCCIVGAAIAYLSWDHKPKLDKDMVQQTQDHISSIPKPDMEDEFMLNPKTPSSPGLVVEDYPEETPFDIEDFDDMPEMPEVGGLNPPAPAPAPSGFQGLPFVPPPYIPNPVLPPIAGPEYALNSPYNPGMPPLANSSMSLEKKGSGDMIAMSRGGGTTMAGNTGPADPEGLSSSSNYNAPLGMSSSPRVNATYAGTMHNSLFQGKMIEAILETSINTDYEGHVRGIVSKHIYSEDGTNVLIAAGSKLIGQYSSKNIQGSKRIDIAWSRVIMPNGVDIKLDSRTVDRMGRSGINADEIDTKFAVTMRDALFTTIISTATEFIGSEISGRGSFQTQTVNSDGSISTTTFGSEPIKDTIQKGSAMLSKMFGSRENTKPTLIIYQGTKITVFLERDIHFPKNSYSGLGN